MKDLVIFMIIGLAFGSCLPFNKKVPNLIKIGIPDSYFCNIGSTKSNVAIISTHIATGEKAHEQTACMNPEEAIPITHGHWIVRTFIDKLKIQKHFYLELYPVRVFDKNGSTTADYWKKAIKYLEEKRVDLILTASGVMDIHSALATKIPLLLSVGSKNSSMLNEQKLWPQNTQNNQAIFFSHYHRATIPSKELIGFIDKQTFNQDKIDYILQNPSRGLRGSSYATAVGSSFLVSNCFKEIEFFDKLKITKCLSSFTKQVKILGKEKKTFLTF